MLWTALMINMPAAWPAASLLLLVWCLHCCRIIPNAAHVLVTASPTSIAERVKVNVTVSELRRHVVKHPVRPSASPTSMRPEQDVWRAYALVRAVAPRLKI